MIGDDGRVADVIGEWPKDGSEFMLEGPLPEYEAPVDVPDHIQAQAAEQGFEVSFYSSSECRTCFFDFKGRWRCIPGC